MSAGKRRRRREPIPIPRERRRDRLQGFTERVRRTLRARDRRR